MATNTGHHLTHVSLFTQIYIAVATIYPGGSPLRLNRPSGAWSKVPGWQYLRHRYRLPVAPSNTRDGIKERSGIFVIQVQFFVYPLLTLLFCNHLCCLLAQL